MSIIIILQWSSVSVSIRVKIIFTKMIGCPAGSPTRNAAVPTATEAVDGPSSPSSS